MLILTSHISDSGIPKRDEMEILESMSENALEYWSNYLDKQMENLI